AFIAYGAWYWYSNQTVDPVTGESVLIDRSLSAEDEKALGLQAYQQILQQERWVDPDATISREIRNIAERLIAKVETVEAALAAEHGMEPTRFSAGFDWEVNVIDSDQANAFALPGGTMAVYTGLVPAALCERAAGRGRRDGPAAGRGRVRRPARRGAAVAAPGAGRGRPGAAGVGGRPPVRGRPLRAPGVADAHGAGMPRPFLRRGRP